MSHPWTNKLPHNSQDKPDKTSGETWPNKNLRVLVLFSCTFAERAYTGFMGRCCDGEADEDVDRFDELLAWFDAWTGGVDDPEFVTRLIEWNAIIDAM